MSAMMESLREDHENMVQVLDVLEHELAVFDRAERPDYEIIQVILYYFQEYPDRCHHPKEDLIFRKLKERAPARASAFADLEAEHEEEALRLHRFAEAVDNALTDQDVSRDSFTHVAREFIDGERKHMEMEERHFFPAAIESLTDEDWSELDSRLADERDPLFGADVVERFQALRRRIIKWQSENQAERSSSAPAE